MAIKRIMRKNFFVSIAALFLVMVTLQSCFVGKVYTRPEVVESKYFRTDSLAQDSTTLAEFSWRELFTDSLLVGHIERALEHNIDIRIALQQIAAAHAYYKQGKAGNLPLVNGSAQATHQQLARNSQFGTFFDGGLTQYEVTASLSWEADIWGKIRSNKRALEASYLQSVAAHQAVKTELVASIASLYYQLLALDEQERITEETIRTREVALETTEALKSAGTVSEVAVKQTEAQLHAARALLIELRRNIRLLENTFSMLLGDEPHAIERTALSDQQPIDQIPAGYPIQLLRNRPDVMAAEFGLINAFALTNVAKSNFYPSLTVSATGGLQSLELDRLFSVNSLFANVVAGLTQPIFNQRRIRTQYEVSQSQQEQAYLRFRQSILNASREVSDALYTYNAASQIIQVRSDEFAAYDVATAYSEELLNSGLANYLEVLTARQNALNSRLNLIGAQYDRLDAIVDLYRALGGGWR
jgi:multidrug efflux system outer membrane protein